MISRQNFSYKTKATVFLTAIFTVFSLYFLESEQLTANVKTVQPSGELKPGVIFKDTLQTGLKGPHLVVVPAGEFLMGSPEDEPGRYPRESPQHRVRFNKPFSLGLTEVTVAQFRKFVDATGYRTLAEREGGSHIREPNSGIWKVLPAIDWRYDYLGHLAHDNFPVVHISWEDAQAYISWLKLQTGQKYRLPSEAELEYANRAGSTSRYWWGNASPQLAVANIRGEKDLALLPPLMREPAPEEAAYSLREGPTLSNFPGYGDGYGGISPVAALKPNSFGLFDTTGNVWEWTADCYNDSYQGAPSNGSAWINSDSNACKRRVLRGGSFYCYPRHLRSANRWPELPTYRGMYVGFRVARDL